MSMDSTRDECVLTLRAEGRSFGAIARELSLENAAAAYDAFQQALRNTPAPRRADLQLGELERLDRLAAQLGEQHGSGEASAADQLLAINRLRARELAEWVDRVAELPIGTIEPS